MLRQAFLRFLPATARLMFFREAARCFAVRWALRGDFTFAAGLRLRPALRARLAARSIFLVAATWAFDRRFFRAIPLIESDSAVLVKCSLVVDDLDG